MYSPYIHVEFYQASFSVQGDIKNGVHKLLHLNGRRWVCELPDNMVYVEKVEASLRSEEETDMDGPFFKGYKYGRFECHEYDGIKTIQINAVLPKDWFHSIVNMATSFTADHHFGAQFTLSNGLDEDPCKIDGDPLTITGIDMCLATKNKEIDI